MYIFPANGSAPTEISVGRNSLINLFFICLVFQRTALIYACLFKNVGIYKSRLFAYQPHRAVYLFLAGRPLNQLVYPQNFYYTYYATGALFSVRAYVTSNK